MVFLAPLLYSVRSSHIANTSHAIQAAASWPFLSRKEIFFFFCHIGGSWSIPYLFLGGGLCSHSQFTVKSSWHFGKLSFFFLEVFICGGYNGEVILGDLWKLNLLSFQWTKLLAIMPEPAYFHCAAVTPVCLFLFFTVYIMCHITICSESHFVVTCIFFF